VRSRRLPQRRNRFVDIGADLRRQLDDGCVQLGLERARQLEALRAAHESVDAGCRLERLSIEDHQLFFDAEGERRGLAEMSLDHALPRMPCTGRPAASQA
jgi:hypothetical protein